MYSHIQKKFLVIICTLFFVISTNAQIDTSINIDVLRAPVSPASNLLGISPSEIEKPTDVKAVMMSLQNATNGFTSLPKSYALDIAPFLLGGKYQDLTTRNDFKYRFMQSFVTSVGINNIDSSAQSDAKIQLGIGIKFSIVRGEYNDATRNGIRLIHEALLEDNSLRLSSCNKEKTALNKKRAALLSLISKEDNVQRKEMLNKELGDLKDSITKIDELSSNIKMQDSAYDYHTADSLIRLQLSKIKFDRRGFFLDFSAGMVADFLNNRINNSAMSKTGAWLTGGWNNFDAAQHFSALGIVRYLYNPKEPFADTDIDVKKLSTLDCGGRFIFNTYNKKLLLSAEGIYRSILNKANEQSSWRLIFNAEYEIGTNQRLTFSFGRNFDGETYNGGNLVAGLGFLFGLGKTQVKN